MQPLYGALPWPICQCRLHVVLWYRMGTPMPLFAAEPRSTTGRLFHCQYLWNDLGDPVFDGV